MDETVPLPACVRPTAWEHLALLPATEVLAAAQIQLADMPSRNQRLGQKLISRLPWEYVLIDTPPSLGFISLNALSAADWVLIPVQASFLALHGLRELAQTVAAVRDRGNSKLFIGGVLLTMYDHRTLLGRRDVRQRVEEFFGDVLFDTFVRRSVAFDYATVAAVPGVPRTRTPAHSPIKTWPGGSRSCVSPRSPRMFSSMMMTGRPRTPQSTRSPKRPAAKAASGAKAQVTI